MSALVPMQGVGLIPMAGWDLTSFLTALKNAGLTTAGLLLSVLGILAITVAVVKAFGKLTSEQSRESWGRILGIFILGGVCLTGGITFFIAVATGLQGTVSDLGNGP